MVIKIIILVFLLLVSACKARHFGFNTEVSVRQSLKVLERFREKLDTIDKQGDITASSRLAYEVVNFQQRPRRHKTLLTKQMMHRRESISAGLKKSVVSWHVPNKHHDQYPGIYSDYPKPRSRPPSHN